MTEQEASNSIEKAINNALSSNEDHDENDILLEWVVVAFVANPDSEKGNAYPMFYSNGEIPHYRARGLLLEGLINI